MVYKFFAVVAVLDILCLLVIVWGAARRHKRINENPDHPDILTLHDYAYLLGFDAAGNMVWKLGARYYHTQRLADEVMVIGIDRKLALDLCRETACA